MGMEREGKEGGVVYTVTLGRRRRTCQVSAEREEGKKKLTSVEPEGLRRWKQAGTTQSMTVGHSGGPRAFETDIPTCVCWRSVAWNAGRS